MNRRTTIHTLMRSLFAPVLLVLAMVGLWSGEASAQAQWRDMGMVSGAPLCVYLYNAQEGVVGGVNFINYTSDGGNTWHDAAMNTGGALTSITAIRCFDGKKLYAAVEQTPSYELWESVDSGHSWVAVPPRGKGEDVFIDYTGDARLAEGTVARLDANRLIIAHDDSAQYPDWSTDNGKTWSNGPTALLEQGIGACADPSTNTYYISEEHPSGTFKFSTDNGQTWSSRAYPTSRSYNDVLECSHGHLYVQTFAGYYRSDDGGANWIPMGGPTDIVDDVRIQALGCNGLTLVAFDGPRVWITGWEDAPKPPTIVSKRSSTSGDCDTSSIVYEVTVGPSFIPFTAHIDLTGPNSSAFQVEGPDSMLIGAKATTFRIRFSPHAPGDYSAVLSLLNSLQGSCPLLKADLAEHVDVKTPQFAVTPVNAGCGQTRFTWKILNQNCGTIQLTQVEVSNDAAQRIQIQPFDSTAVSNKLDSIVATFLSPDSTGTQVYVVHIKGFYEPLHYPIDTTISIPITSKNATPQFSVIPVTAACGVTRSLWTLINTNCSPLAIGSIEVVNDEAGRLHVLQFDSLVAPGMRDSVLFSFTPPDSTGTQVYKFHLHGFFEPFHTPYDTVISVSITTDHFRSLLSTNGVSLFDFGSVGSCNTTDSVISLFNNGCDTLYVVTVPTGLNGEWSAGPETDTLRILPGDSAKFHLRFGSDVIGTHDLTVSYHYRGSRSDSTYVTIRVTVVATPGILALPDTVVLPARTICQGDSLYSTTLTNAGCDTIRVNSARLLNGSSFALLDPRDTLLAPGGKITFHFRFGSSTFGNYSDRLALRQSAKDGSLARDTSLVITVFVGHGEGTLASLKAAYDLGSGRFCEDRDTTIVFFNSGCDSVCVDAVTSADPHFIIIGGRTAPHCLAPGELDTFMVRSVADTTGHPLANNGAVIVSTAGTPFPTRITLTRSIDYPTSWRVVLSPPQVGRSQIPVTYTLAQVGTLPSDVKDADTKLIYDDDLLMLTSIDEPNVTLGSPVRLGGGLTQRTLHISNVGTTPTLATIHFLPFLSKRTTTPMAIDAVSLSGSFTGDQTCAVTVTHDSSSFSLDPIGCGFSEMIDVLGGNPIRISSVYPNPASDQVTIDLSGPNLQSGHLSIYDILGHVLLQQWVVGERAIHLDVASLPAGIYRVVVESNGGISSGLMVK